LVDLFGGDLPRDARGIDVDRQCICQFVDCDIGVIFGTDIDPAIASMDCATLRTNTNFDPIRCLDKVVLVGITVVTEAVVMAV
jgi:hypothetical protein